MRDRLAAGAEAHGVAALGVILDDLECRAIGASYRRLAADPAILKLRTMPKPSLVSFADSTSSPNRHPAVPEYNPGNDDYDILLADLSPTIPLQSKNIQERLVHPRRNNIDVIRRCGNRVADHG